MLVKCYKPLDELTVQIWLLYHYLNFKKMHFMKVGRNYVQTDKQIDKQMDDSNTRCPRHTFQT